MQPEPADSAPPFQRARTPEQKRVRSDAILEAARRLAVRDGVGAVSLGGIASEIGVHKTALLTYFATREEIFLRVAEAEWESWADGVGRELRGRALDDERLAETLARSLTDRPLFCQLLTYSALTLERNASPDALGRSKRAALAAAARVADAVHASVPGLARAACLELVTTTGITAAGLWQIAHPPPELEALRGEDGLHAIEGPIPVRFDEAVGRFIRVYLAGLRRAR